MSSPMIARTFLLCSRIKAFAIVNAGYDCSKPGFSDGNAVHNMCTHEEVARNMVAFRHSDTARISSYRVSTALGSRRHHQHHHPRTAGPEERSETPVPWRSNALEARLHGVQADVQADAVWYRTAALTSAAQAQVCAAGTRGDSQRIHAGRSRRSA